jgi:hypothetical protein
MKRTGLLLLVGFGSYLGEAGAFVAQLGTEIEHFSLERLKRHPAERSNVEIDTQLNGGTRRVPHPARGA